MKSTMIKEFMCQHNRLTVEDITCYCSRQCLTTAKEREWLCMQILLWLSEVNISFKPYKLFPALKEKGYIKLLYKNTESGKIEWATQ